MANVSVPAKEYLYGILAATNAAAVTEFTFCSYDAGAIATATSGFCGICAETNASAGVSSIKMAGCFHLKVNGNSANIAASDPIKPTTGGLGVKAATNKDAYSAIALEASTTDADYILVRLETGVLNV